MNRRISHGQAIRSTLAFSLVTHFTGADPLIRCDHAGLAAACPAAAQASRVAAAGCHQSNVTTVTLPLPVPASARPSLVKIAARFPGGTAVRRPPGRAGPAGAGQPPGAEPRPHANSPPAPSNPHAPQP